jgi:hypothetical protein|tara:strand:+ start:333 stop:593 length:261 start_codon:yes stop_codon:yes gene_type:complete
MTPEEIMEVLQWARDNNVIRIKVEEVEAEFAPAAQTPEDMDLANQMYNQQELNSYINSTLEEQGEQQKKDEAQEQKERDEMMYYSS